MNFIDLESKEEESEEEQESSEDESGNFLKG